MPPKLNPEPIPDPLSPTLENLKRQSKRGVTKSGTYPGYEPPPQANTEDMRKAVINRTQIFNNMLKTAGRSSAKSRGVALTPEELIEWYQQTHLPRDLEEITEDAEAITERLEKTMKQRVVTVKRAVNSNVDDPIREGERFMRGYEKFYRDDVKMMQKKYEEEFQEQMELLRELYR
ncbi:hypothetical protein K440DRAFT_643309 [Wilcoxina mikolae CBS 423.85]|nr:hypothetical protein K440DRAFT_643309 [Wilcoxina mikolae CBS 423.85]